MKLTVLLDNNTYIDQYFVGEPGLSFYIEDEDKKILFDTGYSHVFIENAKKMEIDLNQLTHIVMSHGHNDHTRGLIYLAKQYDLGETMMVAHPDCFMPKREGKEEIGSSMGEEEIRSLCQYRPTSKTIALTKRLIFLGEIPQSIDFEQRQPIGEIKKDKWESDYVLEDSALVYRSEKGLFIITGCSHSGICNIIEYAKKVTKEEKVYGVIGGFHLLETGERLTKTITYFVEQELKEIYPCHCVCFHAKAKINEQIPIHEVGVGLSIEIQ